MTAAELTAFCRAVSNWARVNDVPMVPPEKRAAALDAEAATANPALLELGVPNTKRICVNGAELNAPFFMLILSVIRLFGLSVAAVEVQRVDEYDMVVSVGELDVMAISVQPVVPNMVDISQYAGPEASWYTPEVRMEG